MQPPLTCRSASLPVAIFTLGCSMSGCSGTPSSTFHTREVQSSNAHPPETLALYAALPLFETSLTSHVPPRCSIHTLGSPRLL